MNFAGSEASKQWMTLAHMNQLGEERMRLFLGQFLSVLSVCVKSINVDS